MAVAGARLLGPAPVAGALRTGARLADELATGAVLLIDAREASEWGRGFVHLLERPIGLDLLGAA